MCSRREVIPGNSHGAASTAGILFPRAGRRDESILFGRGRTKNPQPNQRMLEYMQLLFFPDLLLHDMDYVCLHISFSIWPMSLACINFKCMHVAESEWSLPG